MHITFSNDTPRMQLKKSCRCCSQAGTDIAHSGLRVRQTFKERQDSFDAAAAEELDRADSAAAAPADRRGVGRCVGFKEAPRYLRREFILSGYHIGRLQLV